MLAVDVGWRCMLVCGEGLLMPHQEVSVHVKYVQWLKAGMYYVYKNVHPSFEQSEVELNPAKIQQYTQSSHFMLGFSPEKCCENQTQNSYLQQCISWGLGDWHLHPV